MFVMVLFRLQGMYVRLRRFTTLLHPRHVIACTIALVLTAAAAGAQDSTRTPPLDSLAERLRRAEEAIALLREQLASESETAVRSASRVRVELFGRVLMNGIRNSARVNNADVPQFALPGTGAGTTATVRQSSFGIGVFASHVLGGDFEGELFTDFFGGQHPSVGGRHFPQLRIRLAKGTVRWSRGELLVGQDVPLVAGLNPQSVASFGTPEFATAGNLWLWIPQIRGTWVVAPAAGLALQGAILAPGAGEPVGAFDTALDPAERSERPFVQGRVRWQYRSGDRTGEIGVGVHRGWLRLADAGTVASEAVAVDASLPIGRALELRGEWYAGKALRGLGGGGIGQLLTTDSLPVRDAGGWLQLVATPSTLLTISAGCGRGEPKEGQQLPAGRLENRACAGELSVRPGGPLVMALGLRRHETRHVTGLVRNTHVNLGVGFEF